MCSRSYQTVNYATFIFRFLTLKCCGMACRSVVLLVRSLWEELVLLLFPIVMLSLNAVGCMASS